MAEHEAKFKVIQASPKALQFCKAEAVGQGERDNNEDNSKYPFKSLLVGESFAVPFAETNPGTVASLRSSATTYGKQLARKFRVLVHNEYECVEVARIA